ncbi:hypothetical protein CFO_g3585 [Ceratocystis platani]|uniref:Uncharacterized protein n=1 Tax=Ceratocystis fimbriata f. sp. platani TaxID=88771 RepID=A0A0F8CTM9_CERFI|nr:hypothetical protein CFO_g3585 [Ceratocystis platani]
MSNDENLVDSDEALLSIWEHDSGLDAGELRHVKFNNIDLDSDVEVLDEAFEKFGYDPRKPNNYNIPAIAVQKSNTVWDSLRTTSFGQDAIKMSTRYRGTKNLYIQSFDIGRAGRDERWARVNFAAKM